MVREEGGVNGDHIWRHYVVFYGLNELVIRHVNTRRLPSPGRRVAGTQKLKGAADVFFSIWIFNLAKHKAVFNERTFPDF